MKFNRKKQIVDFVNDFIKDNGYAPSIYDIAEGVYHNRTGSASTVAFHIRRMRRDGILPHTGYARGAGLIEKSFSTLFGDEVESLTRNEEVVLDFLRKVTRPPSYREISEATGLSVGGMIVEAVRGLEEKKVIMTRPKGYNRAVILREAGSAMEAHVALTHEV